MIKFIINVFKCKFGVHLHCFNLGPEAHHNSHPQHPLKLLKCKAPDYIDKKCLLCAEKFNPPYRPVHYCDICNFSICKGCMETPPPLGVLSLKTHEHQLNLFPRRIDFTCNACGTQGDRSPYFCLPCNFMIHRECIDLPRVININRHDHRISYVPRHGYENSKCGVCRKKVNMFYGAYSCSKCPNFVVHSRCATRGDIWDLVELEGTPEEPEEPAPFEVIDDNTIKHFSHDHNLHINKDGMVLHENKLCKACVFQICSEPFYYSCEECNFLIHEKCANLPRKKRHASHNQVFKLHTDHSDLTTCHLCFKVFKGFMYYPVDGKLILDVRCASISEPFVHESHPHPLYFNTTGVHNSCIECKLNGILCCDECDYSLCFNCSMLPQKVMRLSYDDHPLILTYGESNVDDEYWCEACETKLNPKKWFYSCNDCGIVLHISCIVGDFFYFSRSRTNASICRKFCYMCKSRCKLPSILTFSMDGVNIYICSNKCLSQCD